MEKIGVHRTHILSNTIGEQGSLSYRVKPYVSYVIFEKVSDFSSPKVRINYLGGEKWNFYRK